MVIRKSCKKYAAASYVNRARNGTPTRGELIPVKRLSHYFSSRALSSLFKPNASLHISSTRKPKCNNGELIERQN